MAEKKDPEITALEAVHSALKVLDADSRQRVLASVFALLEIPAQQSAPVALPSSGEALGARAEPSRGARPVAIVELMQEISPGTNPQRIALFAYYRDKYEGKTRFSRDDLKVYFAKAKEQPPGNFDRDFTKAVRNGWIHEDEGDSYITSKGIEAVESGFSGERSYTRSSKGRGIKGSRKGKITAQKKGSRRRRKTSH